MSHVTPYMLVIFIAICIHAVLSVDPANEMKVLQIMAMRKCCVLAAQHNEVSIAIIMVNMASG